jgi:hypothetical protein
MLSWLFGAPDRQELPDHTEAILGRHLDADFRVFPMAEERQTGTQVAAIARQRGVTYPPEYLAHVCGRFPGIYVEVKEEIWPRPEVYQVGPFWSFLYGLHTFTSAEESEPWMRLDREAESFQNESGMCAAPVLRIVGDADVYCVDARGRLVQFKHETNQLDPVGLTFWELFEREVRELRARKDRKVHGEDKRKEGGEIRPEFKRTYNGNKGCPKCGVPLRSNNAQQCFACGADWHGE